MPGCVRVSSSSASPRPKLSLLWLLLFVLLRLQVAAHQAFTPHVVCPLDGELAHAHAEDGEQEHPPTSDPEGSGPGEDHSEHCGLQPATQPATSEPAHLPSDFVLVRASPQELTPTARATCPERLFLLAPKQSPPSRAG